MIQVVPYDADWPRRFESERARLESVLQPWLTGGIHHIGSTAVPGLAAKPIIDMIAGIRDLEEGRGAFGPMENAGYVYVKHRPEAHLFGRAPLERRTYGIHLTEVGSDLWLERLAFRDALRGDAGRVGEYARLKQELATAHPDDIKAYTDGKRAFVAQVLADRGIALKPRACNA